MSALGQKRTLMHVLTMSALPLKADIWSVGVSVGSNFSSRNLLNFQVAPRYSRARGDGLGSLV